MPCIFTLVWRCAVEPTRYFKSISSLLLKKHPILSSRLHTACIIFTSAITWQMLQRFEMCVIQWALWLVLKYIILESANCLLLKEIVYYLQITCLVIFITGCLYDEYKQNIHCWLLHKCTSTRMHWIHALLYFHCIHASK